MSDRDIIIQQLTARISNARLVLDSPEGKDGEYDAMYDLIDTAEDLLAEHEREEREKRVVYQLTARDLDNIADRKLADHELDAFEHAFPNSSLPETIHTVLDAVTEPEEQA